MSFPVNGEYLYIEFKNHIYLIIFSTYSRAWQLVDSHYVCSGMSSQICTHWFLKRTLRSRTILTFTDKDSKVLSNWLRFSEEINNEADFAPGIRLSPLCADITVYPAVQANPETREPPHLPVGDSCPLPPPLQSVSHFLLTPQSPRSFRLLPSSHELQMEGNLAFSLTHRLKIMDDFYTQAFLKISSREKDISTHSAESGLNHGYLGSWNHIFTFYYKLQYADQHIATVL